ncbi:MAG: tetratricopeptide repeat protein [Candidatus Methylacidiphilales bacterium]
MASTRACRYFIAIALSISLPDVALSQNHGVVAPVAGEATAENAPAATISAVTPGPTGSASSSSTSTSSDEESQALATVQSTFDDGLFDLAQQRLTAFAKSYPNSPLRPRAQLLNGRALYYMGRMDAALGALEAPLPANAASAATPETKAEVLLWQGEVLLALDRYPEAEARFSAALAAAPGFSGADQAELGRAWSMIRQGRHDDARKILTKIVATPTGPGAPAARIGQLKQEAALLLAKQEIVEQQYKAASKSLQEILAKQLSPKTSFEAWYLLAEVYVTLQQPGDALAAYKKVTGDKAAFPKELVAKAWYGTGRVLVVQADLPNASAAFEQAFFLAESEQMKLVALRSYLEAARKRQALPDAVARLQDFARRNKGDDGPTLYAIGLALAESYETQRAVDLLEAFIRENPASPWRAAAYFQLSKLYLQDGNTAPGPVNPSPAALAKSLKALDQCLEAGADTNLTVLAMSERASLLLRQNKLPEALAEFEKAANTAPALSSSAEEAHYEILCILARQGKLEAFGKAEDHFRATYPRSHYRAGIALLRGEMLERLGQNDEARKVYEKALAVHNLPGQQPPAPAPAPAPSGTVPRPVTNANPIVVPNNVTNLAPEQPGSTATNSSKSPQASQQQNADADTVPDAGSNPGSRSPGGMRLSPGAAGAAAPTLQLLSPESSARQSQLLIRLGDLLYKTGDLKGSRAAYQRLLDNYPDDFHVPEAASKLMLDGLAAKTISEDTAIAELLKVRERFWKHPSAPHLLFQIGELYFNRGDFVNAQLYFEDLAKDYPTSDLADDALYWAGVSAAQHSDYNEALSILQRIPDNSPRKAYSRFIQARIFFKLLKFGPAITLLEVVTAAEKSGPRFVEATLRLGDCHFELGKKDTAHYEQAAAAYRLIINGSQGTPAQRSEAGYKCAKTLEKLERKQDALALYLDVLGGRVQTPAPTPTAGASAPKARSGTTTAAASPRRPALTTPAAPATSPGGSAMTDGDAGDPVPPGTDLFWVRKSGLEAGRIKEEMQDWRGAIAIYKRVEQLGGPNEQEYHDMIMRVRREHYIYE